MQTNGQQKQILTHPKKKDLKRTMHQSKTYYYSLYFQIRDMYSRVS
jgi:hypothetical protein